MAWQGIKAPKQTIEYAFPYYCPGARRGNIFVATWLLRPRPRGAQAYCMRIQLHVVLARFSFWSSIFGFFWCWEDQDALLRPLFCFSLNNYKNKKKKKKEKRFVPRPCFFPASRKTTPSSVARCFVRISGRSTVVCSNRVTLWLSTVECCRQRDREVSWQSFSPESEPFEARSRGKEGVVSLRSSGSKSFARHLTSESRSQDLNRQERLFNFCSLVC